MPSGRPLHGNALMAAPISRSSLVRELLSHVVERQRTGDPYWAQGELAKRAGIAISSISRLSRDRSHDVKLSTLRALGDELGFELIWRKKDADQADATLHQAEEERR